MLAHGEKWSTSSCSTGLIRCTTLCIFIAILVASAKHNDGGLWILAMDSANKQICQIICIWAVLPSTLNKSVQTLHRQAIINSTTHHTARPKVTRWYPVVPPFLVPAPNQLGLGIALTLSNFLFSLGISIGNILCRLQLIFKIFRTVPQGSLDFHGYQN